MGNFRDLEVWQHAYRLTLCVYRSTESFPPHERYGLTIQIRRAAVSVASNIAEGCGRLGDRELIRYLRIARGSVREVECQLQLARDLGYLPPSTWEELDTSSQRVSRMLKGMILSLTRGQ